MIEFEIAPCTNVRCKPEHVQTIREKMAKAVKAKYRAPAPKYSYPKFEPGMTTAAYLNLYAIGNPNRIKVDYNCPNIDKPAPTLDPMRPEVEQLPDSED
jgi:hypothetical protein